MILLRRFGKNRSLRAVNVLGLAIVFACIALSYSHVKNELSYDRFHANADRIVRMTVQYNNEPVDGRIYSPRIPSHEQLPEVETMLAMSRQNSGVFKYEGKPHVVNNYYFAGPRIFDIFTLPLTEGDVNTALRSRRELLVSESFARRVFGGGEALGRELIVEDGDREASLVVTGVYEDMPANSHFHTDLIIFRPEQMQDFAFVYLLLKEGQDMAGLHDKLRRMSKENYYDPDATVDVHLMPITDIHLHSRNLREMEPNGNIYFIWLIAGANLLLLAVVFFNLWLNASLIFSYNRRYYHILSLNGAGRSHMLREEAGLALMLGIAALAAGVLLAMLVASSGYFSIDISLWEYIAGGACFILLVVLVSLLPLAGRLSISVFVDSPTGQKPRGRGVTPRIKVMLTAQYAVVMLVVILAFGIGRQMHMIKNTQVGAADSILVMQEQPDPIKEKYAILKNELLKHPEITGVTAAMEPPGGAVRDYITVRGEYDEKGKPIQVFVVSEDFIPFFNIGMVAGRNFAPERFSLKEHYEYMTEFMSTGKATDIREEYVVNLKALALLGYDHPEDIIGRTFDLFHSTIDYIGGGTVVGVTEDFKFTSMHEEAIPMFILQRPLFQHNIMVRLDSSKPRALEVFNEVWHEVYPDYPPDYAFIQDVYGTVFRNELNAERLVRIFSLLCFLVANLGLIIFMAFMIRVRTKEIGIRKVNGARAREIVRMLNGNFLWYIVVAFVIATPAAFIILQRWLQNFAYRITPGWWIFAGAGITVLVLSLVSVSWQSWRAATANPVDALKIE